MDAQGMTVKWVRGPLVVHLYRSGQEVEEVQAPAFQGRTKMLRQDMAEGKVTLSIHQVQLSDAGQYTCYFQAGPLYSEASFDLLVAECQKEQFSVTDPTQLIQAKQGENITISCELSTKKDGQDMTVNSFRNQTLVHRYPSRENLEESQRVEFQRRMELLKHDMAEGKVTLRIHQVQVSDAGPYTCYFHSSSYHSEAHIELQVAGVLLGPKEPEATLLWACASIKLLFIISECHLGLSIEIPNNIWCDRPGKTRSCRLDWLASDEELRAGSSRWGPPLIRGGATCTL
ncbi:selection and upkeep of intraepithelial T-cells protein 2-like [Dromiciops gliroides]|uniref:selection and upkeep of intraepithelial T-cells protein 2-like n=1 Tax=Dromiciops gliroides TaxID=33562 RepID=UPI001CC67152|nr:selection and upkeep of intraepithelial T-cells protein 2-like [Dromiciops gliroides]